jgi:hypothetical protein
MHIWIKEIFKKGIKEKIGNTFYGKIQVHKEGTKNGYSLGILL